MITVTVNNRLELTGNTPHQVGATIENRITFKNPAFIWCEPRASVGHIRQQVFMKTPDLAKWVEVVGWAVFVDFSGRGFDKEVSF